jgi:hypothetical protein
MFDPSAVNPKNFFLKGTYVHQPIRRYKPDGITLGDVFSLKAANTDNLLVKIVECTPCKSYAFDVGNMPSGGKFYDEDFMADTRMEFFLRPSSGGTSVEIRRRKKGFVESILDGKSFLRNVVNKVWDAVEAKYSTEVRTNPAQAAAEDLSFILTGQFIKGDEVRHGDIVIKRDDSYRKDF